MQGAPKKLLAEVILRYAPLRATSSALEDSTRLCISHGEFFNVSFLIKGKKRKNKFALGAGGY